MNNDKLKFVVDSRSFDGSCVTTMSDGIHSDYHHETLEELRDRERLTFNFPIHYQYLTQSLCSYDTE